MTDALIKGIAEDLDCGFRVYVHRVTREVLTVPDADKHPDMDTDPWRDSLKEIQRHADDYVQIEGMDDHEAFRLMEGFADTVDQDAIREKLKLVLSMAKPFRNFKFTIDQSGKYREEWFAFKARRLMEKVRDHDKEKRGHDSCR